MLTIRKLTMAYGGRTLFEEADLTINWGERVALVGPNGAGKSTLFQIILGNEVASAGKVERDEYAHVGYLSQEAGDPGEDTVLQIATAITPEMREVQRVMREHEAAGTLDSEEYAEAQDKFTLMNGFQLEPKGRKILAGLGFRQEDFDRPASEMSGGWIMRAHLAQILCLEPDLLMLDEPTNHLDLLALLWFRRYLSTYPGAILMISHDRHFVDDIVETVVEIDEQKLIPYRGDYTNYLAERETRHEQKLSAWRNQKKEIDRIQEFIDRFRSVSSKASQVQSRVKQLEKMKTLEKPRAPRKVFKFHFPKPPRSNQKVIELKGVSQAYGETRIYERLDLVVERGDRIVLVGPNGAGKSTLLKILTGVVPIDGGERAVGYATRLGYYSQHRSELLDESKTVLEEVCTTGAGMREEDARGLLGSFLFRRDDVHKKVRVLSGGEKSRLNLVKFLVDPPNLLLMDEPTTHLDLLSVEALIQALKQFEGSLVFISHDVHFIRKLAESTWHISGGEVTRYSGGYDYYLEKSGLLDDEKGAVTA
ncbi:MAG: ABC-F family ATP-binding cassette domain-containing protein [Roseibacillus sp.]|jgi:ATP-binding cassette subfamily F protein 3|nr:ABC transporter ATP-binding protein [Roseibacillus sp.]MCP4730642.1 ABC-F family ATP-binding cassette domain-containing protein [Roseibacillus sp.]MDP7308559.1 ABC-F family ATP-binding cassette domain-containing protein [Roseibacillus sp.]HJM64999.1 ABC-F family ATP-binding cassette domain-containing protein [Roseibacillus sp.]|tara:strand:- start:2167 stop:3774 length:1608 start_codon:yes stop_codon:yes gene_type:complete